MEHGDLLLTSLVASIPGIVVAWFTGAIGSRRSSGTARQERRRHAAGEIRNTFVGLHNLASEALIGSSVEAASISRTMVDFERLMSRYEDLLPDQMRHLRRSAREAMATLFGGPAVAALDVRMEHEPISEIESYWAEITVTWMEHVIAQLHAWEDNPSGRTIRAAEFYSWRKDTDDWYRGTRAETSPSVAA